LHHPAKVLEWRPVPRKVVPEKVPLCDMEGVSRVSGDGDGMKKMKHTRRGQRRRRMDQEDLGAPGRVSSLASPSLPSMVHPPRSHILKRSRLIDQAEEDFHRALFVNVLGQEGSDCAAVILEALASKYGLEADALQIRRAASNSFLAFFPSVDHAVHALAGGNSISIPPSGCILGGGHVRRRPLVEVPSLCLWMLNLVGFRHTSGGLIRQSICSVDTALFRVLHPDTIDGTDMSVLKLKAWGFSMDCLPSRCDLHVEEPTSIGEDGSCFPRTLIYSVSVKVTTPVALPVEEQPLFSSPDDDEDRDSKHQHQRQHLPNHQFSSVRNSVHARLGPRITPCGGGGTVDAAPLPNSSVDELQAPVPSFLGNPPSPALGAPIIANIGPLPASVGDSVVSTGGKTADMTLEPSSGNALVPLDSTFNLEEQSASRFLVSSWDYKIRAKPPCFKVYVRKKNPGSASTV
jgi:hypothetical protein